MAAATVAAAATAGRRYATHERRSFRPAPFPGAGRFRLSTPSGLPFSANIAPMAMLFGAVPFLFHGGGAYSLDARRAR